MEPRKLAQNQPAFSSFGAPFGRLSGVLRRCRSLDLRVPGAVAPSAAGLRLLPAVSRSAALTLRRLLAQAPSSPVPLSGAPQCRSARPRRRGPVDAEGMRRPDGGSSRHGGPHAPPPPASGPSRLSLRNSTPRMIALTGIRMLDATLLPARHRPARPNSPTAKAGAPTISRASHRRRGMRGFAGSGALYVPKPGST